jgi:hypothetical protein
VGPLPGDLGTGGRGGCADRGGVGRDGLRSSGMAPVHDHDRATTTCQGTTRADDRSLLTITVSERPHTTPGSGVSSGSSLAPTGQASRAAVASTAPQPACREPAVGTIRCRRVLGGSSRSTSHQPENRCSHALVSVMTRCPQKPAHHSKVGPIAVRSCGATV